MNPDHLERLVLALESIAESFQRWANPAAKTAAAKESAVMAGPLARTHAFHGEQLTVTQIAERVGVSRATMYGRLNRGLSAEQAAVTTKRATVRKVAPEAKGKVAGPVVVTAQPLKLDKGAEATVPDNVKRTVAETPKPRFEPDVVVPTFSAMKPGQYLDSGAPWIRAATGPRR